MEGAGVPVPFSFGGNIVDAIDQSNAQIRRSHQRVIESLKVLGVEDDYPALILYAQTQDQGDRDIAFSACMEYLERKKGLKAN